jgi:hypothetical protein
MKLKDFLDVADDDDMVEVYADDGATRPCEMKLVDAFQMSDWVGGILDVQDELEVYLDREVTGVATVKLDGCGDDVVVGIRVYVEQKEGDEDVRDQGVRKVVPVQDGEKVPEVPDGLDRGNGGVGAGEGREGAREPGEGDMPDGHGQMKTILDMEVGPTVTGRDGDAFDLTEAIKSNIEARIRKGHLVPAFQGCWDMLRNGRLRFSVTKMSGYVYRVAIHVANGTQITADELQTTFGNIAASLGFGRYVEAAWCDDHKVGYLGIVDGEIVCAMDFDFTEGE